MTMDEAGTRQPVLQMSEERFRSLMDLLPVAFYTVEASTGEISCYNSRAVALWGRRPAPGDTEERWCECFRLWMPDAQWATGERMPVAQVLADGRSFRNLRAIIDPPGPDAARVAVLVDIDPIRDGAGRVAAAVIVFRDLTAHGDPEPALRQADTSPRALADDSPASTRPPDHLKPSDPDRDELLSKLAHDLRNPLAPLRNGLQIMKVAAGDAEAMESVRVMMERQLAQLTRLIDERVDPPVPKSGQSPAGAQRKGESRQRRRILVVDDNRDAADTLASWLEITGSETLVAHDGLQALEIGAVFKPHVLLLDLGMPALNGFETCRRVRLQPWGRSIVIVACTGWGQENVRRRSKEAGFDFHMVKPVDPAELERLLADLPPLDT